MSSDYESCSASPSSSSSEEEWDSPKKNKSSRARRAKKRPTTPTRRNPRRYTTAEMEHEIRSMRQDYSDDESSEEEVTNKRPQRKSRRLEESESDDEEESSPPRSKRTPTRPTRSCAVDTQRKMSSAVKSDRISEKEALADALEESEAEMLDSSDGSDEDKPASRGKRRKKADDSDDEEYDDGLFNDDDEDESSGDDSAEYESEEEVTRQSTRPQRSCAKRSTKSYKVDDADIGTADEESADEEYGPSLLISPSKNTTMPYGSPKLREKARAKRKVLTVNEESDEQNSHDKQTFFQHKWSQKQSPVKLKTTDIVCSSTHDEITMMELPKGGKPHICYVTPDRKNRHCFTLETFYRIAISMKSNVSSSSGPLQFLQPPHFRTPISDDLLDQIGSRFGRGALVIEDSALYKKMQARISGNFWGDIELDDDMDNFDSDGEYVGPHGRGVSGQSFNERLQRYIQGIMGSQDLYCCPVCYSEAYRRLGNMDDDEMIEDDATDDEGENENKEDRFSFLDDPMTILGALDNHKFEIASSFCFLLLTGVKNHLKSVHHVDVTAIQGNDLFKRFQIRASDGLLQRWLRKSLKMSMAQPLHLQGDMMRYWNEGENQSFLLLLNKIEKREMDGEQSGDYGSDFSESFPNRAKRVWVEISSPFLKGNDDIEDFLADDDESDGDHVPINPHFTPPTKEGENFKSPEDELVEYLQRKNSQRGAASSGSENDGSSSENYSSDELEVLTRREVDDEEVEDEWMKSKQLSTKKKATNRTKRNEDTSDSDDPFEGNGALETSMNGSRKSIGMDDSDDEKPLVGKSSSKRTLLSESSDEE